MAVKGSRQAKVKAIATKAKKSGTGTIVSKGNSFSVAPNKSSGGSKIPPPPVYDNVNYSNVSQIDKVKKFDEPIVKDKPIQSLGTITGEKISGVPAKESYKPTYGTGQMQELVKSIQDKKFAYDPTKDVGLKQAQEQMMGQVAQQAGRRGMLYSEGTKSRMGQVAGQLAPSYEQKAYDRYKGGINDLYKQLQTMQGMEGTAYDKYRTGVSDVRAEEDRQRNIMESQRKSTQEESEQAAARETEAYGVPLSPIMRQHQQVYNQMTQEDLTRLLPYQQNFQSAIDSLSAVNPNHPDIAKLEAMRASKILSDPVLLDQYGGQYGLQTGATRQLAEERIKTQFTDELDMIKQQAETMQEQLELDKISRQIEEIEASIDYKDAQTVNQNLMAIGRNIENSFISPEKKAQLNNIANQIYNRNRASSVSERKADIAEKEFGAEYELQPDGSYVKKEKPKDAENTKQFFIDTALEMSKPKFDTAVGEWTRPFNKEQIEDYIINSGMSDEDIVDALNKIPTVETPTPEVKDNRTWFQRTF